MSHFTVLVIGEDPETQLAPFDENLELPRYVKYTKEQLIEEEKQSIKRYEAGMYAEFLKDPEKYKANCNEAHANYIENEFPLKLKWSDEEIYQNAIGWYEPEEIGKHGEVYSTSNPQAKWDWYSLGGRWSGLIKLKEGAEGVEGRPGVFNNATGIDQAVKSDIANFDDLSTFAILKDGKWYERGGMGWWGIVHDEKDENKWEEEFKSLVAGLPDDTLISIYDCHI